MLNILLSSCKGDHELDATKQMLLGISLGMRPANERRRCIVTTSLIGWTHT